MNLQRGTPCWSTQIMRTVRSECSSISAVVRSAASCCALSCSPCSVTKPCLPTPRSPLIYAPSLVAAEDHGCPDRDQPAFRALREDQAEHRVVVGVDRGGYEVAVCRGEAPHRVAGVVGVEREGARAVEIAEVDLALERLVHLAQRIDRVDALVDAALEEAPADLTVGAALELVGVRRAQRLGPVEEAVVAERELAVTGERLGVGVLDRGQLVGPA